MARYRSRSYSPRRRSRSPRIRGRKRYDDEPRRSYGDRRSPAPSGLLVRNLPLDASGRYGGSSRRTPPRSPRRRYHCQTFWHDHVQVVGLHSSEALTPAHLHQCVSQDSKVKRGTFKDFRFIEIKERDHKVKQHAYLSIKASQYVLSIVSPSPAIQWNWISYCVTSVKISYWINCLAAEIGIVGQGMIIVLLGNLDLSHDPFPHAMRGTTGQTRGILVQWRMVVGVHMMRGVMNPACQGVLGVTAAVLPGLYSLMDVEAFVPVGSCYAYNAVIRINKEIGQDQMKAK
ncbi:hypothetical protein CUMW_020110 [Citrus unshiu]|nr:hypothetical protein CUMW_020110 [Citrus unshiu]